MYICVCFLAAQDAPGIFPVPALETTGFVLFYKLSIHNGYEYFVGQMCHKFPLLWLAIHSHWWLLMKRKPSTYSRLYFVSVDTQVFPFLNFGEKWIL